MGSRANRSQQIANIIISAAMTLLGIVCLLPIVHVLAFSLSSPAAASAGKIALWPIEFTMDAYIYVINEPKFGRAFLVSVQRIILGLSISTLLTILTAYPLSKESAQFRPRTFYAWFFVTTMLFGGGLIPTYIIVRSYGLMDTIWALVLPGAVQVFNITLMLNFFRGLPKELGESAFVDGADHWTTLFRIYLPLSLPSLATISLFTMVGHWNSWFDGLIYMNRAEHYPLQTYLQTIITKPDMSRVSNFTDVKNITTETVKTAQIIIGMVPIIAVYPFLQRYFVKGIVLGSVKG
ncbi:carbohydrate ABC transporter permease [Paenibacillus eucommiae]|uniref:Aldouronate transport system permease protein n=1 Tax=Paenibacillus eucommiae TaxID=1355755 RepID=A0ABS4J3U0_9BACL|nr:carbohydrate ABC transporter permease [Paenibacillus eucommiae]MBP1994508.1 putative aldouronate transport system permease protein [Paenibacillus eucommiae]